MSIGALEGTEGCKTTKKSRGRGVALAAALAIHAVIFIVALSSMGGAIVTGGTVNGASATPVMLVSLVGLKGNPRPVATASDLDALFRRVRQAEAPLTVVAQEDRPKTNLDKLFEEIDHAAAKQDRAGTSGKGEEDRKGEGLSRDPNAKTATDKSLESASGRPGLTKNSQTAGGLWGQIEPCWRRLPGVSKVPVSLEIVINDHGLIAAPPKLFRPNTAHLDEGRLMSEARALDAIAACVPYVGVRIPGSRQTFKVDFQSSH